MNPVEKAHPLLIVPCRCGCGCGLNGKARQHTPDEYEDLDALTVEERAAIICSLAACNRASPMAPYGSPVDDIVRRAYFGVPCLCDPPGAMTPDGVRDEWAEAEARISGRLTGMARP